MTEPAPIAKAPRTPIPSTSTWTVDLSIFAFWLLIQLAGLAMVALHLPLAASYPPGERLGLQLMLALQIGMAPASAPSLSRSLATLMAVVCTFWPTLALLGAMQVEPIGQTVLAALVSTAWMLGLTGVCSTTRIRELHGVIVAAGMLVAIGGAILAYLALEFGSAGDPEAVVPYGLFVTPILLAWRCVDGTAEANSSLLPLALFCAAGIAGAIWAKLRHRAASRSA